MPWILQGRPKRTSRINISPHGDLVLLVSPLGAGSTMVDPLFRNGCSEAGIDTGLAGYISLSVVPPKNELSDSLFILPSATQKSATHCPALFFPDFLKYSVSFVPSHTSSLVIHRLVLYPISPSTLVDRLTVSFTSLPLTSIVLP